MSYQRDNSNSLDNQDKLYTNKFIDPEVYDISNDKQKQVEYVNKKKEFRKFMEGKRPSFEQLHHPRRMNIKYYQQGGIAGLGGPEVAVLGETGPEAVIPLAPNDPLNTNPLSLGGQQQGGAGVGGRALNKGTRDNNTAGGGEGSSAAAGGNETRFVQEFHTYIHIDSRDRDKAVYPNPNNYRLLLKRNFTNIKEVKLKSTEFPNTQQLIRSTPLSQANNRVFWNIEEDGDQLYVAVLQPGSYDATTFAKELSDQMSGILRNNTSLVTLEEQQQTFSVTIDTVTDIVHVSSVNFNSYSLPFSVVFGSNVVRITSNDIASTIKAGDRIIIENSVDVGGIPDTDLDGEHIVAEVPNPNEFRIEVDSVATSSVSGGGGTSVRIGKGLRFRLLWSEDGTPASILGFEEEDTDYALFHENTKDTAQETLTKIDDSNDPEEIEALTQSLVHIHEVEKDPDSTIFSIITTSINHGLTSGDRIYILDYDHTYGVFDREQDLDDQGVSLENASIINKYEALINAPAGHIVTVVDAISFKVPAEYTEPPLSSISDVKDTLPANYRNARIIQRNLNKALKLSGENYIYMTSPLLESMLSTAPNENNVIDVFYVLQLNAPPGSVMFNSFVGNPKRFYEAPLPFLDEVEFKFITHDGELFEFNDQDHSFTLEFVEAIQKVEGTEYSSQIGATT
jgi:hypothetical protein